MKITREFCLRFLILVKLILHLSLACSSGFFEDEFSCRSCHPSCDTCDSYSACTICAPGFTMNSTTGLCDGPQCSSESCVDCGGSCSYQCAYQMSCYTCVSGEYFDLDTYSCVSACDPSTQIAIDDTKLGGIPVCRSFNYYVNPLSDSTTELGTLKHPYKELNSVFMELFHFHSHSEREIVINLFEDTTNYVKEGTFLIEINKVAIRSYSSEEFQTRKAKIVGIEKGSNKAPALLPSHFTLLSKTFSHLLGTSEVDYLGQISSDSQISSEDKDLVLNSGNGILYLFKTSLQLDELYISTEYSNIGINKIFLNPIQLLDRKVSIASSNILHTGRFLHSSQQMSLEVANSEFDLHKSQGGFNLLLSCIQGQAKLPISTRVSNTKFYFSQDPPDSLTTNFPPFVQNGGHDVSVENVTLMFYGDSGANGFNFLLRPDQTCDSSEMTQRIISLKDIKIGSDPSWGYAPEDMYFGVHLRWAIDESFYT
ncbi:unnamed protein product [Moneuplotes crassus]|uniref:Uncharacterized protein n=1 Tax=Euplotes crassus TaxID=5936 RepID=A0AAD1UK35_EUPCR|nr:unnamed protein product [Moneuplotes crassus]